MLNRVVDGDTLLVTVDLGFGIWRDQRLRLRGLDAPPLETLEGVKAKKFVEKELKKCEFLILKTYGTDLYERYLVDVFYLASESDEGRVMKEGLFLNQRLLDAGFAKRSSLGAD